MQRKSQKQMRQIQQELSETKGQVGKLEKKLIQAFTELIEEKLVKKSE